MTSSKRLAPIPSEVLSHRRKKTKAQGDAEKARAEEGWAALQRGESLPQIDIEKAASPGDIGEIEKDMTKDIEGDVSGMLKNELDALNGD